MASVGGNVSRREIYLLFFLAAMLIGGAIAGAVVFVGLRHESAASQETATMTALVDGSQESTTNNAASVPPDSVIAFGPNSSLPATQPSRNSEAVPTLDAASTSASAVAPPVQAPVTQPPPTQPPCVPNQAEIARLKAEYQVVLNQWARNTSMHGWQQGNNAANMTAIYQEDGRQYQLALQALEACQFAYWHFTPVPFFVV